jgi:formylglycine-generating enzyme required for sulfatase activity
MKNRFFNVIIVFILATTLVAFADCGGGDKKTTIVTGNSVGDMEHIYVDSVGFNMIYVPGKTFKTGTDDSGITTVSKEYWIGETEVTYELWNKVHTWALSRGYTFANAGTMGSTIYNPVTTINWRDTMVWCNSVTEWYNENENKNLTCVYTVSSTPIRNSSDANATQCDAVTQNTSANGFRLLTSNEWELAARYIDDVNEDGDILDAGEYYPGNYASGATGPYTNAALTQAVAWYNANSGASTHPVKGLAPNALGLYDMSGNIYEFCFDSSIVRGGSWSHNPITTETGSTYTINHTIEIDYLGLRMARNAD